MLSLGVHIFIYPQSGDGSSGRGEGLVGPLGGKNDLIELKA